MKIFRKILKYFIWLSGVIVVFLIAFYFFIQTDTFNRWALNFALGKINNSENWLKKENSINIESISGNILKGLRVNNVVITVNKDTLVSFKYLDIKYDIWGLIKSRISLDYVVLNSPEINLTKIKGGSDSLVWNITNLFTPSADTTHSDFNWEIIINSFRIENGKIKIEQDIPSKPLWAVQWEKQKEFSFDKLNISDLQLEISGEYSKEIKKINLQNLSFNSNTDVTLKKLAFEANINTQDTLTEISNLELLTDRSDIKLKRLVVNNFYPLDNFDYVNFGNNNLYLILNFEKFNFADLKYFIPSVDMLDGTLSLYLNASGVYKNLIVNNLTLNLPNSNINLKGNIQNLNDIHNLYFDVTGTNKINPADVNSMIKIKSIPDFRKFGIVLADITYKGSINDFYSNFDVRSAAGNVQGQIYLNIGDKSYSGNLITNRLNLAPILNINKLKSNLNLIASFEGSGFSPNTMIAGVKYNLGSSSAAGYNIANSSGTVNINRNNINLNIKANSSAGNATVSGKINISNMKNPVYAFKGTMNNVDLSRLPGKNDKSNLNAVFDIKGSGNNMKNLAGRYDINFGKSFYSKYEIPETKLNARLNMSSDSSYLHLTNKAMEVKAGGKFSLASLIDIILYNISQVSNIVEKKLNPDTSINYTDLSRYNHSGKVNLNYEIVTKDSAELRKLSQPFGIIFNGDLKGNLSNSPVGFNSNSAINIKNFRYHDTTIVINNFNSNIALSNDYMKLNTLDPLTSININLNGNAGRLMYDSIKIDSLIVGLILSEEVANLKVSGKMDSVKYARMTGEIDLKGNEILLNVDSLYAKYNSYVVTNDNRWSLGYVPQSVVNVNQLGLKSGKMVFNIYGIYSLTGASNITIKGENINVGEVYGMLRPFDTLETGEKTSYPVQGEFQSVFVNLQGTPEDLNVNLDVKTSLLKYDTVGIGNIVANVKYKDQVLSPDIVITNNGNKGTMKITGNIPFKNPIIQKDTLAAISDKPSDVHFTADNFQIQYFSKLFPGIGDLQGVLNGTLNATGTYYRPDLKGDLTMVQGKYFVDFTGMYYDFKFKISTDNSKLIIDNISLYNPSDENRHIDLSGNIDFKGYNLNGINLTTSGDMILLDNSSKENKFGLTGYLLGGIGDPPITINGDLKKLNINGQFLVKDASISSLPKSGKGYQTDETNIVYLSANDSAISSDTNRSRLSLNKYQSLNPFVRDKYILVDSVKSFLIMNILALNIEVKTVKNLKVSIDFQNLTRDRLFGEVSADIVIRSDSGRLRTRGEIDIVGNSYYRFYRDFKVKDSRIIFHGPINRPELDIRAVYENTKSTEQYGSITSSPIQVVLTVTGNPNNPEITLKLYENGTEMFGNDATSDAITFLLFGKYKNELSASETQSLASGIGSTVGSLYVTSFVGQILRNMLPFIQDAELNYTEGVIRNTNASVTSEILDAQVTVGSRMIDNTGYLEYNVEYPINNFVTLNLPEKLILLIAREQLSRNVISNSNVYYSTGAKVLYKLKF